MKRVSLLFLCALGCIVSCSDETTVFSDPQDDVLLETNQQALDNSIVFGDAGVLDITEQDNITGKLFSKNRPNDQAGDYPLTLVAQIDPPSFSGGENLTASHVHVDGDYAYVSYNTVGEDWVGGADIINISDPNNPRVTSRLYYINADLSAIKYSDGYAYVAGGFDSEKSATVDFNSFVGKIPVTNGKFDISGGITYGFQVGFVGTDIVIDGNTVYVTTGKDGALGALNKSDLSSSQEIPYADLRSVAVMDDKVAVLDAASGVNILDRNFNVTNEIGISSDFGDATKKTISLNGDKLIVSEGPKGAGIYNAQSGAFIEHVPILINPEDATANEIVTNAVTTNDKVLLMANGGAGLCLSEDTGTGTDLFGIIELEGSINYVESKGDYIFAASGTKGLQIIKMNKPSESLAARCATLPAYSGSSNLNVNQGDDFGYSGSKRFNNLNINGSLTLCGSWTVRENIAINNNALFEMNGTLVVARNSRRRNITVGEGATFRVEGNLTIYGDLILNDGATIEFIGDSSVVNIFGSVTRNGNATVTGNFDDIQNKF